MKDYALLGIISGLITLTTAVGNCQQVVSPPRPHGESAAIGSSGTASSGQAVGGLAVSIQPGPAPMKPGRSIPLIIEVRNVASGNRFLLGDRWPCWFTFQITDVSTGIATSLQPSGCQIFALRPHALPPGKSSYLYFDLSDYWNPPHAGQYRIVLTELQWYPSHDASPQHLNIDSNAVTISVAQQK